MRNKFATQIGVSAALVIFSAALAPAAQFILSIDGTDAIFLAGRDDITVPSPSDPWTGPAGGFLVRHGSATPEEAMETFPSSIPVATGDTVKVADPAVGGINFFNGFGPPFFGPEGNSPTSSLTSLGDLSGYLGTQGALAGVFLDDNNPNGSSPPATLDFSTSASRDFLSLSPGIGQVFFIGDGQTSGGTLQEFVAPTGATRLFFGIPDGFGFNGPPGAYDDNDGSYRITVGVNEDPPSSVPEGGSGAVLLGMGILAIAIGKRCRGIRGTAKSN